MVLLFLYVPTVAFLHGRSERSNGCARMPHFWLFFVIFCFSVKCVARTVTLMLPDLSLQIHERNVVLRILQCQHTVHCHGNLKLFHGHERKFMGFKGSPIGELKTFITWRLFVPGFVIAHLNFKKRKIATLMFRIAENSWSLVPKICSRILLLQVVFFFFCYSSWCLSFCHVLVSAQRCYSTRVLPLAEITLAWHLQGRVHHWFAFQFQRNFSLQLALHRIPPLNSIEISCCPGRRDCTIGFITMGSCKIMGPCSPTLQCPSLPFVLDFQISGDFVWQVQW